MGAVCDCSATCTDYTRRNSLIENENMERVRHQKWTFQQDQYDIISGGSSSETNSSDDISRNKATNNHLVSYDDDAFANSDIIRENIAQLIMERESQSDMMRPSPSTIGSSPSILSARNSFKTAHRNIFHLEDSDVDLSIFEEIQMDPDDAHAIAECPAVERIVMSLIYYSSLDPQHRSRDRKQFEEFMMDKYRGFFEDYIHLMQCHGNDLNEQQLLFLCDHSTQLDVQSWFYMASSYYW